MGEKEGASNLRKVDGVGARVGWSWGFGRDNQHSFGEQYEVKALHISDLTRNRSQNDLIASHH